MIRLDGYLCTCKGLTRSEAKKLIKEKRVSINDSIVSDPSCKVNDDDMVKLDGEILIFEEYVYIILNKPSGYVTARTDSKNPTVMDLIGEKRKDLSPVGRLDIDTEGILLITDNGKLNHNMLSPSKHVDKCYLVRCAHEVSDEDIDHLKNGVDIGDDKLTLPAKCERSDDNILLTIQEGRYHQVKRMLAATGNEVVYLKRLSFGPLSLDDSLNPGEYRKLNKEELESLKEYL
ncbi:MAG: rRNA pseudouridine synthase [Lachnospiraceae bacterium]|nr:rRNA pseudouridine synthase [Lachnospiraceae bacterium]